MPKNKAPPGKRWITLLIDRGLIEKLDKKRDLIPRNRYIIRLIENDLKE